MFSHVTLGTNDVTKAEPFYDAIMAVLGQPSLMKQGGSLAYGSWTGEKIFIVPPFDGRPASHGNGEHIAFITQDRAIVDAFHAAALANGGSDEGAPGLRPHYHANYYGAYVRDPDGNKLQAVCHRSLKD
ncbi:VOC family protein [Sphingoaurantiacus capsulatus]|uniref:VOC family protein n=1 Tax=Sphingoaurantiacus capsulatus TaxID=1771310 RepID=A0ABV7XC62_9SPHN